MTYGKCLRLSLPLLMVFGLASGASQASAATINCAGVANVATQLAAGGDNCFVTGAPGILFSDFTVSPSAGFTAATVGILGNPPGSPGLSGSSIFFDFSIGDITGAGAAAFTGDVLLRYAVTGGIQGVGLSVQAIPNGGGNVTVLEKVCTIAFVGNVCNGLTLANFVVVSVGGVSFDSKSFGNATPAFILEDIQFNGANADRFISSFTIATPVPIATPEPMTFSLMGLGLLGLGFARRFSERLNRKEQMVGMTPSNPPRIE